MDLTSREKPAKIFVLVNFLRFNFIMAFRYSKYKYNLRRVQDCCNIQDGALCDTS